MPSLIGNKPNQVPSNGDLGTMAFREQDQFLALAGTQTVSGAKTFSEIITASKGVAFPATQVASADANTLDDYEEGTWTPTAIGTSTAGSATYTARIGKYTKIGNTVTAMCSLGWSAHTGSGDIAISGLPFTSASYSSNAIWAASVYANDMNFGTLATQLAIFVSEADTVLTFRGMINNATRVNVPLDTSVGNLVINLTYYV
jgi:hypothetical protein